MKIDILKLTNCQMFLFFIHFLRDIFVRVTCFLNCSGCLFVYLCSQSARCKKWHTEIETEHKVVVVLSIDNGTITATLLFYRIVNGNSATSSG